MSQKKPRKTQLFKRRVQKLIAEGRDYSTQPILGLDADKGLPGFYKINRQEQHILNDIFRRFVELNGNLDRLLGYCHRRSYTSKIQSYRFSGNHSSRKTGGKSISSRYLWRILTYPKLYGYCSLIDHDDVFPVLQREGKRLILPLKHGCVIDSGLATKARAILLSKFNTSV